LGPKPSSYEALVDSLIRSPRQLHKYGELGVFFSRGKQAHFEPVKMGYTEAFDGDSMSRSRAEQKGEKNALFAHDPRLSLMSACSLSYLEEHTTEDDWHGGLLGRFFLLYAQTNHVDPWPKSKPVPEEFIRQIELRASIETAGPCVGRTEAGADLWDAWWDVHMKRKLPPLITGAGIRIGTLAVKMALIYAWDFGCDDGSGGGPWTGQPWELDVCHLLPALQAAELYIKSLESLSGRLARHGDARLQRKVLDVFGETETLDEGQIAARTQFSARNLTELLKTLVLSRRLGKAIQPGQAPLFFLTAPVPAPVPRDSDDVCSSDYDCD
jgi:hypothetical protein